MLTLLDLQIFQSYTIQEDRKTMAANINKLVRQIVIEKEKASIFRRSNESRKVAYNMLREELYKQICVEFHIDQVQYKQYAKKYVKHKKQRINMTFGNLMSLNQDTYNYTIKLLGVMLDEYKSITAASKKC